MSEESQHQQEVVERHGRYLVHRAAEAPAEHVLALLHIEGQTLKSYEKAEVRLAAGFVLKETNGWWDHTFRRERRSRAWRAAWRLRERGVLVPEPVAFIEKRAGLGYSGAIYICEYLERHRDVEQFLAALIQRGAGQDTLQTFLLCLADAINDLTDAGAYHADLSGKNIFTLDGDRFYFIDLDAVELDLEYTAEKRLKNHIQLYDSFCDALSDKLLVPFIERMLPRGEDPRVWMPKVRKGQSLRRQKLAERRARQGIA